MKQFVKDLVHSYEEPLKEIRHHLHENPELSFEEYRTAEYIRKALGSMGIALQDGITGTSTVSCLVRSFFTILRPSSSGSMISNRIRSGAVSFNAA